jgi:hypothetical protein
MTPEAALAIALACTPPSVAPILVGIAQQESGLNPSAIHWNENKTFDAGISQINSVNFGWLGVTKETLMDPCVSFKASARVLFARYNGNAPGLGKTTYADGVSARVAALTNIPANTIPAPPPCAPPWDAWARAACSNHTPTTTEDKSHAN